MLGSRFITVAMLAMSSMALAAPSAEGGAAMTDLFTRQGPACPVGVDCACYQKCEQTSVNDCPDCACICNPNRPSGTCPREEVCEVASTDFLVLIRDQCPPSKREEAAAQPSCSYAVAAANPGGACATCLQKESVSCFVSPGLSRSY